MRKAVTCLLIVLFYFIPAFAFAQTTPEIDSLKNVLKTAKEDTSRISILVKIGRKLIRENVDTALVLCNQALLLSNKYPEFSGRCYRCITEAYFEKPYFEDTALFFAKKYLEAELTGSRVKLSDAYSKVAYAFSEFPIFDSTIYYYQKAMEAAVARGDSVLVMTAKNDMAWNYRQSKQIDRAIQLYKEQYAYFSERNDTFMMANACNGIGICNDMKKDYAESLRWFTLMGDLLKNGTPMNNAVAQAAIALTQTKLKNFAEAEKLYLGVLSILKTHSEVNVASAYIQLTELYRDWGKYALALQYADTAMFYLSRQNNRTGIESLYKDMAECYSGLGDYKNAFKYQQKHQLLRDSLMNETNQESLNTLEARFKNKEKQSQIEVLSLQNKNKEQQSRIYLIIALSLVFIILTGGVVIYQRNRIAKQKTEKNMKDLQMQALRAQMNPHFVFNCMNSIQRYILKNDKTNAVDYLQKFATLIRLILDNSEQKTVSLKDELEMLELYMQIESLRLEHGFDYEINAKDELKEQAEIPSMILQPYVENAIWHGLANKENRGKIKIDVLRFDHTLQCVIADNGIGRKKAAELKEKSVRSHQSKGMGITEQRLKMSSDHPYIHIEDLTDNGEATGTKVTFRLQV